MMINKKIFSLVFFLVFLGVSAEVGDNRFFPFYQKPVKRDGVRKSSFVIEPFFCTGNNANGNEITEKRGIFDLYGPFDLKKIGDALTTVGKVNYLRAGWQAQKEILWNVYGKIQAQGFIAKAEYHLTPHLSVGFDGSWVHASMNQQFILPHETIRSLALQPAEQLEMDEDRRLMLKELGFESSHWATSSFADSELYIRWWAADAYKFKMRYIDAGFQVGLILPVAQQRDYYFQASLPLGGEGMYGVSTTFNSRCELKEDLWLDFFIKINKRLDTLQIRRLPVKGEPEIFGATVGPVLIDPGISILFSPSLTFDDIENGYGIGVQYIAAFHHSDTWQDRRTDQTIPVDFSAINTTVSRWKSEYVSFTITKDFLRSYNESWEIAPHAFFSWMIPVSTFDTHESARTQKVSFGLECRF